MGHYYSDMDNGSFIAPTTDNKPVVKESIVEVKVEKPEEVKEVKKPKNQGFPFG